MEEFGSLFGNSDKEQSWFIVLKIIFKKNGTKEVISGFDPDKIIKDYETGYLFLVLNTRYHIVKGKALEKLMSKYSERFEGSLFERVLKGQVKPKTLVQYFSKDSLYYLVHLE